MPQTNPELFDFRDLLFLIRRQAGVIVGSFGLVLGAAIVFLLLANPTYTATTLLLFDPSPDSILDPNSRQVMPSAHENLQITSEVEILKSDVTMLTTIRVLDLLKDPDFRPGNGALGKIKFQFGLAPPAPAPPDVMLSQTLEKLKNAVTVRRKPNTFLIEASATTHTPSQAALLINTFAKTHIKLQLSAKINAALRARDALQEQAVEAQLALAQSERALNQFVDIRLGAIALDTAEPEVLRLHDHLTKANAARLQADVSLTQAQRALQAKNWPMLADTLSAQALVLMVSQQGELARKLGKTKAENTTFFDLQTQLIRLDKDIATQAGQQIELLQSKVTTLDNEAGYYRDKLRQTALIRWLPPTALAKIYELQQESDIARRQYKTLLSALRRMETKASLQIADIRILSPALPPTHATFPRPKRVLSLALFIAMAAGLGAAVANEYYRGGITTAKQLSALLPVKTAATVPHIAPEIPRMSVADIMVDLPLSAYAESIRRLRVAIDQTVGAKGSKARVIMVTSALAAEGKTSTSLALARAYGLSGLKTLLIDADLRNPSLHRCLKIRPFEGLSEFLTAPKQSFSDNWYFNDDPKSPANVVLGRGGGIIPADRLLQSNGFSQLITKARAGWDVVIIDTPPFLPVVDAAYIAPHVDAAVLCVRYRKTSQSDLQAVYERLRDCLPAATAVLPVLNQQNAREIDLLYAAHYSETLAFQT